MSLHIRAVIFVERPTQKAILIGSGGSAIKRLGQGARAKVEEFVGAPVYLDLWVKVLPKWRKNPLELQRQGTWVHLWRVVGQYSNVSIFDVESSDELHQILWNLPLFPFMTVAVTPLTEHPSALTANRSP